MSKNKKRKKKDSIELAAQFGAAKDVVEKYGSAAKQHFVAYTGQDNEIGKTLKRGLNKTSKSKISSGYKDQNIKQQAGYAAEDIYTARKNAKKIINGDNTKYTRTDDLGRVNDPLYDHVLLDRNGSEILGTGEQMKFVGSNPKEFLTKLKSKDFQKYLDADATITVPSDYYEGIVQEANNQIQSLEKQLAKAEKNGNSELANSISKRIDKVKKIKNNVKDSGITNKEAIFARLHPKLSTAKDIAEISHRAGKEQVKYGALIGGGFSLIKNVVAVSKGKKDAISAAKDFAKDTGKGVVTAYATGFAGSVIKAGMQNAGNATIRTLSKSNVPAMIVTSTIDVSTSLLRYMKGEISGTNCLEEIGEKGVGNISAAMFAIAGQSLIPIPIVGAMIGSMVGYALSSTFYSTLTESLKYAKIAHEERVRIEKECEKSIELIKQYRAEMNSIVQNYLNHHKTIFNDAFSQMDNAFLTDDIDMLIGGANKITIALGGTPQFTNMDEHDKFMESDEPLIL